jgi:flavin-dependent dehydrogenase
LKRLDLDGNKLNWEMLPKTLWSISSTIRLYKNTSKWSDLLWEYFDGWYTRQGYKLDENYKIQEFVQNDQKYKVGIEEWSSLEDATQKAMDQLNLNEESPKYVLSRENYSWSYEVILITNHESV